jgi:hypothetical protein
MWDDVDESCFFSYNPPMSWQEVQKKEAEKRVGNILIGYE